MFQKIGVPWMCGGDEKEKLDDVVDEAEGDGHSSDVERLRLSAIAVGRKPDLLESSRVTRD